MAQDRISVALVGFEEANSESLAAALTQKNQYGVVEVPKQLSAINGQALSLSAANDLILFRTEAGDLTDIDALEKIRGNASGKAQIAAVTDASASLEVAQKLTQAGADYVFPDTLGPEELVAQLQKRFVAERPQLAELKPARHAQILTVARARGGAGGTTFAVNLADALLDRRGTFKKKSTNRVAILDLDLQFGKVAGFLDVPTRDGLYQMAEDKVIPDKVFLEQSMSEAANGVRILSAPSQFAPLEAITSAQINAILTALSSDFDYVIVDVPMALVNWVAPIMTMSDKLYIVTDSAVPSIHQARRLIEFYTEDAPSLPIEIVINNEKKPLVRGRHHVEAAKVLERPLDIWLPQDVPTARAAIDRGVPLNEVSKRSPLTRAIRQVAKTVIQTQKSHATQMNA
ncbi:CpaE family protein [Marimonas sp. MJW-29]|uniref:CpaE family protein n=1 Tax=Sulfitobacter sediminis TaxID=3234186 RepID=A0ABV3RT94_9RHOB